MLFSGIDFYIGPPKELYYRLARNYPLSMQSIEVLTDPKMLRNYFFPKKNPLFLKSFSLKEAVNNFNTDKIRRNFQ